MPQKVPFLSFLGEKRSKNQKKFPLRGGLGSKKFTPKIIFSHRAGGAGPTPTPRKYCMHFMDGRVIFTLFIGRVRPVGLVGPISLVAVASGWVAGPTLPADFFPSVNIFSLKNRKKIKKSAKYDVFFLASRAGRCSLRWGGSRPASPARLTFLIRQVCQRGQSYE